MYTTTGEKLTWAEFEARRINENIFIGDYPKEDSKRYVVYAHTHTKNQLLALLEKEDANLDFMYVNGRPTYCDMFNGECAAVKCLDGFLWNSKNLYIIL